MAYAGFAKRRAAAQSVVLVRVEIPDAQIKNLNADELQRVYWPSFTWKELLFHCRRGYTFVLPKHLSAFLRAKLIIGTISGHTDRYYERLASPADIKETDLFGVGVGDGTGE